DSGLSSPDPGYAGCAPPIPTNVEASDGTYCGFVRVTWNPVSGASEYRVYRDGSPVGSWQPGTSYDDYPGDCVPHDYQVKARNSCGESGLGSPDPGYAGCAPSAPTNVQATDGTHCGFVRVTWNPVSGASEYRVYRDGSPVGSWQPGTSYDDYPGDCVPHDYQVKARNSCGESGLSSPDPGYAGCAPPIPTNVQATDGTYPDMVRVSWDSVPDATAYEVWRNTSSDSNSANKVGDDDMPPYDDNGIVPGVTYHYWLKAKNNCGTSNFSLSDPGYAGLVTYRVTATAGPNGTIDPNGTFDVNEGNDVLFRATPDPNFAVDKWYLDSNIVQIGNTTYMLYDIQLDHSVHVTFRASGGVIYVDDDAPGDPGPNDPCLSDPCEDGSQLHPYDEIQEAIDEAIDGDTVFVLEGRYYENIQIGGKNIILTGSDPNDPCVVADTIIDGNDVNSVVTFAGTEDASCLLTGFTITNGFGTVYSFNSNGGGINGNGTTASVRNCRIINNTAGSEPLLAEGWGAGIYDVDGEISDCEIRDNSINRGGSGGGLASCDGPITNCRITDNSSRWSIWPFGWGGGGLYRCNGPIISCIIAFNSDDGLEGGGKGGGLSQCDGQISNCLIYSNRAFDSYVMIDFENLGGGLYDCDGEIVNCTIAYNVADNNGLGGFGGAMANCDANISNCIIWGNIGPNEPQLHACADPNYSCIQDWTGGGVGNIASDPCFGSNDYSLLRGSDCIDVGDNDAVPADVTDLDGDGNTTEPIPWDLAGNSRITDGDNDGNSVVDMGAYEYVYLGRVHNVTQDTYYERIKDAVDDANNGDEIVVYPGTYTGDGNRDVDFLGKAVTVRSVDPNDPNVVVGTIIDCCGTE
ncbi:MAG: hypothetical protein ACYTEX_27235, partial [Planctomycetota bacterium]